MRLDERDISHMLAWRSKVGAVDALATHDDLRFIGNHVANALIGLVSGLWFQHACSSALSVVVLAGELLAGGALPVGGFVVGSSPTRPTFFELES